MTRGFSTRSLHAGAEPDAATGARATPIHQTTSYVFDDADTAAELYALRAEGHVYSRLSNPTVNVLEERLADLAGGSDAVATGSGMAAFDAITTVLASAGDNVVASSEMYGGTAAYLTSVADRRGIETRLVDTLDYGAYAHYISQNEGEERWEQTYQDSTPARWNRWTLLSRSRPGPTWPSSRHRR